MHCNVVNYEPHTALFVDDEDPLLFYRRILKLALSHLNLGGHLFFEINEALAKEVVQLVEGSHFGDIVVRKDINGKDRMIKASKIR